MVVSCAGRGEGPSQERQKLVLARPGGRLPAAEQGGIASVMLLSDQVWRGSAVVCAAEPQALPRCGQRGTPQE